MDDIFLRHYIQDNAVGASEHHLKDDLDLSSPLTILDQLLDDNTIASRAIPAVRFSLFTILESYSSFHFAVN